MTASQVDGSGSRTVEDYLRTIGATLQICLTVVQQIVTARSLKAAQSASNQLDTSLRRAYGCLCMLLKSVDDHMASELTTSQVVDWQALADSCQGRQPFDAFDLYEALKSRGLDSLFGWWNPSFIDVRNGLNADLPEIAALLAKRRLNELEAIREIARTLESALRASDEGLRSLVRPTLPPLVPVQPDSPDYRRQLARDEWFGELFPNTCLD